MVPSWEREVHSCITISAERKREKTSVGCCNLEQISIPGADYC